jgi:hypothetical protein
MLCLLETSVSAYESTQRRTAQKNIIIITTTINNNNTAVRTSILQT